MDEDRIGSPALRLLGVTKRFGPNTVVDGVSLTLGDGEILSLVGASGCGKSTLLRLVAGLEEPTAGEIAIGGRVVAGPGIFVEPERRGVGFIFQDYALFPHLTVAQNVAYGLRGPRRAEAPGIVDEMLERVGLPGFGARRPHELSGGEQQRVALARALAPRPSLLLLDEPFSNLDRRLGDRVRARTLALLRELGAAAILVTHDPEEAMASGDRVALLRSGRLVQIGAAEDLYHRPVSREAADFFAAACALPGRRVKGAIETPLGRFPAPEGMREGEAASVYVRAGSVRLVPAGEGVAARLLNRSFLGHCYQLLLAVDGLDEPLRAHVGASEAMEAGPEVHISVNPAEALVFPAERP
ncbi:ABC transporter ATP-binding protein [Hansschlegelia zhihuaiae]|uniref:ABC transporter ATP-binding protein n=1 Tax=Hansschlegelia zhihuaiae TaxID=405005 RepID=A0A4Q0M6D5_9HYPH|nr:ABC transporter ATP-binding protein [Hansschlegelia zhihuaiae]RXF68236.1 ABC transporter ATP-binding protein [Hansschlegelia zhihuaiae]